MSIRRYEARDFGSIYALDVLCFPPRFRFSRGMMRRVVTADGAVVLLACHLEGSGAEAVDGFCAVQMETQDGVLVAYLATLDVHPGRRGQGIGRALMGAVESQAAAAGAILMLLHVYTENLPAVRLYEGLGYERVGKVPRFYGPGHDAWFYRKPLPEPEPRDEAG